MVNGTLRNKLQRHINRNSYIFIQELDNVVCGMASIWSRPQCVNDSKQNTSSNAVIIAFCFYTITLLQINYWSLSSDVIWRYGSWSTLVQLFWYLTPTSHSLNQWDPTSQEKYLSLQIMITVICTLIDNHADLPNNNGKCHYDVKCR